VRAIVRSKDRAKELLPAEIELKLGDTCDPAFGDGSLPLCLACYTCCTALWVHRLNPKPLIEACSSLLSSLPSSLPSLLPSSAFPRPSSLPPLSRPQALSATRTPTLTLALFPPRPLLTLHAQTGLTGAIAGVDALIVATGTTAFPTDKWGPNKVCFEGMGGVSGSEFSLLLLALSRSLALLISRSPALPLSRSLSRSARLTLSRVQEYTPQAVDKKGVQNVVKAISEVTHVYPLVYLCLHVLVCRLYLHVYALV
jgi:hypothetical protein